MRFTNQLLTLWYGTDDAPAPTDGDVQDRHRVSVTVAVQPAHPSNTVAIRYRVDGGTAQTIGAARIRSDHARDVEYHRAVFPDFPTGERLEYLPVLSCAGRSVPGGVVAASYPSSCRLGGDPPASRVPTAPLRETGPSTVLPPSERLPFQLDYLATIRVPLGQPETIGPTPEGVRVNWYWSPAEGVVSGPRLSAKVREIGGDWMTIRRDGIGVMDVRATLETADGALIWVEYQGYYELGADGYRDALEERWPTRAPTRTTPRFHTAHPAYLWLNRVQGVGIGEVVIGSEVTYTYDLYAVR